MTGYRLPCGGGGVLFVCAACAPAVLDADGNEVHAKDLDGSLPETAFIGPCEVCGAVYEVK